MRSRLPFILVITVFPLSQIVVLIVNVSVT